MNTIYNEQQQELAEQIDGHTSLKNWKDWKWQLKNSIRDIATFEKLMDVEFTLEERKELKKNG
jgi:lysine 2,3-aminomutase